MKSVQGLRTLLKDLEEEEGRINKEQIKARKDIFKQETFKRVFACEFSPYKEPGRSEAMVQAAETAPAPASPEEAPVRKRWYIPGWDPAHSVGNESLFPSFNSIIPGRNVCAAADQPPEEQTPEKKMTKPEMEAALKELVGNVKRSMPVLPDYNRSLYDLNSFVKQNSKVRTLLHEQNLPKLIAGEMKSGRADDLTRALSRETLTLAGEIDAIPKRGVRILAIDGGGVRAVMTALILKRLQEEAGIPLNRMFD